MMSARCHYESWVKPPTSLPAWIRTQRVGRDESQEQLGQAMKVSQRRVSRWETGEVPISRFHLTVLLEYFQVPRSDWATILLLPAGSAS